MARKPTKAELEAQNRIRLIAAVGIPVLLILLFLISPKTFNALFGTPTPLPPTATVPMPGGIQTAAPTSANASTAVPTTASSSGSSTTGEGTLWMTYFTNPVIPFDGVTTGGIDQYVVELINNAQTSIDAAMYQFNLEDVAQALIAAHDRGVTVRVVYDDEYTADDPQMQELLDAGIPGTPDQRSAFMHNKFMVFDNNMVWTGSLNFTVNGVYKNNNNANLFVSPEMADDYTTEFTEMFNGEFGPRSPANTPYPTFQVDGFQVEVYFSPEDDPMSHLIDLVNTAQQSIHFMNFSFTEDSLGQAMMDRAAAGVEVAGIFESTGANTQYSECPVMLSDGLDVRLDGNPATFHHKVIIVDGQTVATGSFNYSNNATESNDENVVIVHNPEFAARYETEFAARQAQANLPAGGECLSGN